MKEKSATIEEKKYEIAKKIKSLGFQNFIYRAKFLEDNKKIINEAEELIEEFKLLCKLEENS